MGELGTISKANDQRRIAELSRESGGAGEKGTGVGHGGSVRKSVLAKS